MKLKKLIKIIATMPFSIIMGIPVGDVGNTDDGNNNDTDNADNQNNNNNNELDEEKKFSQADLNRLLKKEKESSKLALLKELGFDDSKTAKDGIAAYLKYVEDNKTELQKMTDAKTALENDNVAMKQQNARLTAKIEALSAGVNTDSVDDFIDIVTAKVDENNDAKSVIEKLKNNAAFAGFFGKQQKESGTGTPPPQNKKPGSDNELSYGARLAAARKTRKSN